MIELDLRRIAGRLIPELSVERLGKLAERVLTALGETYQPVTPDDWLYLPPLPREPDKAPAPRVSEDERIRFFR